MVNNAYYLTDAEVARRAGVYDVAYVTADGKFVLDLADFKRLRLTPEEYIGGVNGVEKVTRERAMALIAENGHRRISDIENE